MPAPASIRSFWRAAAALAAVVGTAVVIWQVLKSRHTQGSPQPLVVVVSGDTAGWIVPCGCTSNQSGGLLRRGTLINDLRQRGDVLYADAGGAPGGTSAYQRVKFEAILKGEQMMGLAAHNLGGPEAALGAEYLRRVGSELAVPFVSANLRDRRGELVAAPLRIVDRGGRRVAIVGVLSNRYASEGARIDDPREAILRTLSGAAGRYDSLIVLAYLPEDELRQLAASLPEADVVAGGPTGQAVAPQPVGPTLLASATNKGKFVIQMSAAVSGQRWSGQVVEMNSAFKDDPKQNENLVHYLDGLAREDFPATETGLASALPTGAPSDYRLAGDQTCLNCHLRDCAIWKETPHAHAWQTLSERQSHVDPACQQCHTTGYGLPGGFLSISRSPNGVAVRCESCHGPSQSHARRPEARTPYAARDQCVHCHDRENSPKFDYASYWPQIRHGTPAAKP